ncbi:MAG: hypothetical protein COA42_19600, partial [Alteromonadaceae bacterium]
MVERNLNGSLIDLHPAQKNVYFDQIIDPDSPKYNIGNYQVIECDMDVSICRQAWGLLYQHMDALRLNFVAQDNGLPMQFIRSTEVPPELELIDFSQFSAPESE